nr:helicase POLQ-like isoform X1 [Onthophagus taurus]
MTSKIENQKRGLEQAGLQRLIKKPCLMNFDTAFDDTLPIFDDTQILVEKSRSNDKKSGSMSEFSMILANDGGFTQICNDTQVMKKVEDDIKVLQQKNAFSLDVEMKLNEIKENITPSGHVNTFIKAKAEKVTLPNDSWIQRELNKVKNSISIDNSLLEDTQNEINDTFRKALLENAEKTISPSKAINSTLISKEVKFNNLGNFYGLPNKVKELFKLYRGIENLYDWQDECLNLPSIVNRKNLVYALPTSGGKTLVAEILIMRELLCRKKNAIFVLPFVAIVQEKVWSLSPFAVDLNFLIEEYAAGKGVYPPRKRRRKNSIYIATMEKALGIINSLVDTERLDEIGLVVVDELHLVGEAGRGCVLEELLTKIMILNENIQIVGMSATIGNLSEITTFLNADIYTRNFRPVELIEYIQCENNIAKINWSAADDDEMFVGAIKKEFGYSDKLSKIDPDRLGGLVMEVIPADSCLIFCSTKKNCENVAWLLCRVLPAKLKTNKTDDKKLLKKNLKTESGDLCKILEKSIDYGIAYHHSGLTSGERKLIEDSFRDGTLSVICCTSTLAAGVNLPAKRVILRQPYIAKEFITLSRYKQMVGRAGRTGFGTEGESILICSMADLPKVRGMLNAPMDQALSAMHENDCKGLKQLLLSMICLNAANTRKDLLEIVKKSLLFVQENRLNVKLKLLVDKSLSELFKLGALKIEEKGVGCNFNSSKELSLRFNNTVESTLLSETLNDTSTKKTKITLRNDSKLIISQLGLAAIKGGLELTKAHLLYEDLLQAQASLVLLNCLHLLYLVTPYDIADQINLSKSRYYRFYTKLTKNELHTANIIGLTESTAVRLLNNQPIKSILERVLKRFYVTLILYDLWNGNSIFEVSEKYDVPRGLAQNLMTSAASFSSNVVNFCTELKEFWYFAYLLKGMTERLQHCCIKELLPLMELPSVKQCRAKQLYDAGYRSLASLAKANVGELIESVEHMSRKLANQLIAAAKLLLLEKIENLRDEAEDVLEGAQI